MDRCSTTPSIAIAEPFTLALSAGYFGFFAHAGVVRALEECGAKPRRILGASSGALVGALWAAGMPAEEIERACLEVRLADFWDPRWGLGLLRGDRFRRTLRRLLPVARFEQCRVPFSVSVYDFFARRTRVIRQGDLADTVYASCAVPFLFQPFWQTEGPRRRPWFDGGVRDRAALADRADGEATFLHWLPTRGRPPISDERLEVFHLPELPRLSPRRLSRGPEALEIAYRSLRNRLGSEFLSARSAG